MNNAQDYFMSMLWHDTRVKLTCLASNSVLDLSGGGSANGTRVQGYESNGSGAQRWRLRKIDINSPWSPWAIQNVASGTWLDLDGGNNADGTKVQCWGQSWDEVCRNKNSQWYLITQQENNATVFRLQNAKTFTYVDLYAGGRWNGADVNGWHRVDDNYNQQWSVVVD